MLIAMTGQKRSGKDTVAEELVKFGFDRISFAGTLKGMIKLLLINSGLSEDDAERRVNGSEADKEESLEALQGKSARYAMQTLGTEWRDLIGKNLWSDIVRLRVENTDDVVISDLRFNHEAEFTRTYEGWIVRVVRAGQPAVSTDSHPSEQEMAAIDVDATIYNYGSLSDIRKIAFVIGAALVKKDLTFGYEHAQFMRKI